MKKHRNVAARFAVRLSAMILTAAVLAGTCLIPSRVRAKTNPTSDFIDRTYEMLLGKKPDGERFSYWYKNLTSGNVSASGMIDQLMQSVEYKQRYYSLDGELDMLYTLMTDKLPDDTQRAACTRYLTNGVSIRRLIYDLSGTPEFSAICSTGKVQPGPMDPLEPRDRNPETTIYIGSLIEMRNGQVSSGEEYNTWCSAFEAGKELAPAIEEIVTSPSYNNGTHTVEATVKKLCEVMLGQEASEQEVESYLEMLDNGVSISYVVEQLSEKEEFTAHCAKLGLQPGTIELTQPRDNNYELTTFLTRMYTRFSGVRPTEEALNSYVLTTLEDPGTVREVITEMLSAPECQELLPTDEEFLNTVYEVFYGKAPDESITKAYLIGMSNGITRTRILSEILKDPAFDEKMAEYGIDTHVEKIAPEKIVALTFDDGPYTPVTMRILDALEPYGAHATFFVVGNRIKNYSECLIRATNLGCEIADHTWNHTTLTKISGDAVSAQIWDCADAVYNLTGVCPRVMRPVGGSYNSTVSANVGMPMIIWSVDTNDWKYRDSNHVINEILNNVRDGDIILMHDLYETTATAVETVVPALIEAGYTLVTVSELAEYRGVEMENGKAYFSMRKK